MTIGIAGFVDDCNGQTNSFQDDGSTATVTKVLTQAQTNAQLWTNILSTTGGALEVSKCSCHVMQYKFTVQGAPSLVPSFPSNQVKLNVWDPNDNVDHTLPLMSVYQSHKTLGHYKEPAGHQKHNSGNSKKKATTLQLFYGHALLHVPKPGLFTMRVTFQASATLSHARHSHSNSWILYNGKQCRSSFLVAGLIATQKRRYCMDRSNLAVQVFVLFGYNKASVK